MYDDDHDALAAEYVLGTLSAAEREQAEALLARNAGFAETVRLWEHRLGELNVMVEAVEPPADLWERIKTGIDGADRRTEAASETLEVTGLQPEAADAAASAASPQIDGNAEPSLRTLPDLLTDQAQGFEDAKTASLTSSLLPSELAAEFDDGLAPSTAAPQTTTETETVPPPRNAARWRALAIGASVIAVLLAAYIGIARLAPGAIPVGRQSLITTGTLKTAAVPQLVAVLQQEPTAPAFLVMLDPQQRTITIRRLTAAPDNGRSYELWLNSSKLPKPASLGPVGNSELTTRSIPQNIDLETMRSATYSVSLEPGGGSATGAPTGPTLFRGRMIEAVPGSSG
jgi:anti-sigma-K factor RskA